MINICVFPSFVSNIWPNCCKWQLSSKRFVTQNGPAHMYCIFIYIHRSIRFYIRRASIWRLPAIRVGKLYLAFPLSPADVFGSSVITSEQGNKYIKQSLAMPIKSSLIRVIYQGALNLCLFSWIIMAIWQNTNLKFICFDFKCFQQPRQKLLFNSTRISMVTFTYLCSFLFIIFTFNNFAGNFCESSVSGFRLIPQGFFILAFA